MNRGGGGGKPRDNGREKHNGGRYGNRRFGISKGKEKKKAKADETRKRGEAEDQENHSTAHVTTAVRKATWHEIASADKRRVTSRSNKLNKARNMQKKQR